MLRHFDSWYKNGYEVANSNGIGNKGSRLNGLVFKVMVHLRVFSRVILNSEQWLYGRLVSWQVMDMWVTILDDGVACLSRDDVES